MPYAIKKSKKFITIYKPYAKRVKKNCYSVYNKTSKRVFSKCTTRKKAVKQSRLLRAIMFNKDFVPNRGNTTRKNNI
jgi:hypothetical protein